MIETEFIESLKLAKVNPVIIAAIEELTKKLVYQIKIEHRK